MIYAVHENMHKYKQMAFSLFLALIQYGKSGESRTVNSPEELYVLYLNRFFEISKSKNYGIILF